MIPIPLLVFDLSKASATAKVNQLFLSQIIVSNLVCMMNFNSKC